MKLENVQLNLATELVYNVGCPIAKTNAPRVYNKLFELLDMNAIMLPVEIPKGELASFMSACKVLNIRYFSPTMPHKADIIPLLDNVDDTSRLFQSVNAVRIDTDGVSHGVGMDGKGAVRAITNSGTKLDGISVLMYGAGSISGVIGYELSRQNVKKLYIVNRSRDKAEKIARILNDNTPMEVSVISTDPAELNRVAEHCELMANVTPLGMCGFPGKHDYLGFIDFMPKTATVFDCIINPPQTEVILAAERNHLNTVSGMEMLVNQMDVIFDFMFGKQLTDEHKEACIDELCNFLNVSRK
jgi:shikimate dehydrogenase